MEQNPCTQSSGASQVLAEVGDLSGTGDELQWQEAAAGGISSGL